MAWAKTFADAKDASDWSYLWAAVFSCGYSQPKRDRLSESYLLAGTAETDCSYGVNWSLWKGGILDECIGFSTRTEIDYLEANGFTLLNAAGTEPQRNDVLWRSGHTAMYIGDGLQAEALRTEKGDAGYNGSMGGDQDGGETVVRAYDPSSWTYILRPPYVEPKKNGWIKEDGIWYFYEDGEKACNRWERYRGEWYYLGPDGAMLCSQWLKDNDEWYWLEADGKMARSRLVEWNGGWCAVEKGGACVKDGECTVKVAVKDWLVQFPEE